MAKTEMPAQEMQVVISFGLPHHEDRVTELAMHGEVATRVHKVVEHLKEEFKAADVAANIFSQVVTVRKPRVRRTKAQIKQDTEKGNGASTAILGGTTGTVAATEEMPGIPQFLRAKTGEVKQPEPTETN